MLNTHVPLTLARIPVLDPGSDEFAKGIVSRSRGRAVDHTEFAGSDAISTQVWRAGDSPVYLGPPSGGVSCLSDTARQKPTRKKRTRKKPKWHVVASFSIVMESSMPASNA